MKTEEYLKQRGNELLDFFGIKPTSSLVIKTLRGEVLGIEHRLSEADEKEFLTSFLKGKPEIPAVQIESVQFPNDLRGATAIDLENKVRTDRAYDYNREQEYVLETNLGLTFSKKDWEKQCWKPDTHASAQSEYLMTVRDKRTPERNIIGHSTHLSEKELEINQEAYSKFQDIDSKDVVIETYKIYNSDDPEYQKAKSENLQRYLDDPRNKVDLLKIIDVPETVLVYTNENDKINELYSGNNMLMDFYNKNFDKPGTVYLCTTSNLSNLEYLLQNNVPLKDTGDTKIEKQFFAPELNYYVHGRISNNIDIDKRNLYDDTINEEVKLCYIDYHAYLKDHNLSDIPRDSAFINEAIMYNPSTLEILTKKEKQGINWQDLLESTMESPLKHMPKELITFDLLYKANYNDPEMIYKYLPSSFTKEQIVNLIDKDLKNENARDVNVKLATFINALPDEVKNKDLFAKLHNKYDKTDLSGVLAYSLVVLDLEKNHENAIGALKHFCDYRFVTDYDPIGADDAWGQICGCDYYINRHKMVNPIDKFDSDLLSIQEWHDIAAIDTRMMEFIPKSIIENEAFWNNYHDFIGKGAYLNHPDNEYRMDKFDEYQVFSKMPEQLKTNPEISLDLLKLNVISIKSIKEPTEEHYLLTPATDYHDIPQEFREKDNFKSLALSAFNTNNYFIDHIPEKFITTDMVSKALSYDMAICNSIPKQFLNENLLVDKITNYKQQGFFSDIQKSGEHPDYIKFEANEHTKVLQYIPEELKTDRVCQAALEANPENAAFLPINYLTKIQKDIQILQLADIDLPTLTTGVVDIKLRKPDFAQFPFSEIPLNVRQSVINQIENDYKVCTSYNRAHFKAAPFYEKNENIRDGIDVLHDSIENLENLKNNSLKTFPRKELLSQNDAQSLPKIKLNLDFDKLSEHMPTSVKRELFLESGAISAQLKEEKLDLDKKYDLHRIGNFDKFENLCKEIIRQKSAMDILISEIGKNADCINKIEVPSYADFRKSTLNLMNTYLKHILPQFKELTFNPKVAQLHFNRDFTFFYDLGPIESNKKINNLSDSLPSDMSYKLKQDIIFLATNFKGCCINPKYRNEKELLNTVSTEALELFQTYDMYKSSSLEYKSKIESELVSRYNSNHKLHVDNTTKITINDLIFDNSLQLRELNKDEKDILLKIQRSGRVVDSGISEENKELIEKYFSKDNKELITAIEKDDSGIIADIEGRHRLIAGEILESKGIIPSGSTAKTLEEEGYKVELLRFGINSKTENNLSVDKTNMKAVNNNDHMNGKKQALPFSASGEAQTAQMNQKKLNTNPATVNIQQNNQKDKLSNSSKIRKSHTNDRDSNRKRRGHKF